jgi:hypothetical protein
MQVGYDTVLSGHGTRLKRPTHSSQISLYSFLIFSYKANKPTIPAATPIPKPTSSLPAAPVFSGGAISDADGVIGVDPLGVIVGVVTFPEDDALTVAFAGTRAFKKLSTRSAASS